LFRGSHAAAPLEIRADVPFTLIVGTAIALFPATPLLAPLRRAYDAHAPLRLATALGLVIIYMFAIARSVTTPFQPFIYFRF
jgi:alginate O-acetyltransferase complex protein AlgI